VASVLGRATAHADTDDAEDRKQKGKSSSIIVMSQQHQVVASKTAKKTTASQNKFDIKAIVAAGQEGCYSRKSNVPNGQGGISVGYRERSNPTSGFQTIQIIGPTIQPNSITKLSKDSVNKSAANPTSNGSGGVFASFFS
jgi:hypothetical protein